jgi:hypothetical protein
MMEVHYRTIITEKENDEDKTKYEEINMVQCCIAMKEAWDDGVLHFGEAEDTYAYVPEVNISDCHPYPEGACWDDYKINFCPFCGDNITLVEKEVKYRVLKKIKRTIETSIYVDKEDD